LHSYRELVAWQKAVDLVTSVYSITKGFPGNEVYGLASQMRRSAVSVPSNIAEGQGHAIKGGVHPVSMSRPWIALWIRNPTRHCGKVGLRYTRGRGACNLEGYRDCTHTERLVNVTRNLEP